jgi:signal transduction histidine kinase
MTAQVGRRLIPLSAVLVAATLLAIVLGIALFAFGTFVGHVRAGSASLAREARTTIAELPRDVDALAAAKAVAPRLIDPALLFVVIGNERRVTVLRATDAHGGSTISILVRARADRSGEPQATGTFARLALGIATIAGLPIARASARGLDVYATENQSVFVADVRDYVPAFGTAIGIALLLAFLASRVLARDELRPLVEVTYALERFASGDFTPGAVDAGRNPQLGDLARAYNGAVAQVERSFAERERANALIRQFIADAGHQLRTPLTVIRGFTTILRQSELTQDPESAHILTSMGQQTVLMSKAIEKLILLERWENETPDSRAAPGDIGEVVAEVVAPLALAHPTRELEVEGSSGAYVVADIDDIKHALANVIENALKYTPGRIVVGLDCGQDNVRVVVRDDGPGMSADEAAQAFERFYRGPRRDVEGSGLGLAIAKRAVERAGGTLVLRTDPASGTLVSFTFPRAANPAADE